MVMARDPIRTAEDKDVRLGGGVYTIRQYLRAVLIDEMQPAITPVLQGSGEALFAGIDAVDLGIGGTNICRRRASCTWC